MKNFNSNRLLSVFTLLLLIANIITLILLWSNKNGKPGGIGPMQKRPVFEFISKELSFTETQQSQFKKLRETHQAQQKPIMDSIRMAKDAFFDLLKLPNVSDTVLQKCNAKIGDYTQQLDLLNFKHFQQLRLICTPEQQAKFDKIINKVLIQMAGPKPLRGRPGEGPEGAGSGRPDDMPQGKGEPNDGPPGRHPQHPPGDMPPPPEDQR